MEDFAKLKWRTNEVMKKLFVKETHFIREETIVESLPFCGDYFELFHSNPSTCVKKKKKKNKPLFSQEQRIKHMKNVKKKRNKKQNKKLQKSKDKQNETNNSKPDLKSNNEGLPAVYSPSDTCTEENSRVLGHKRKLPVKLNQNNKNKPQNSSSDSTDSAPVYKPCDTYTPKAFNSFVIHNNKAQTCSVKQNPKLNSKDLNSESAHVFKPFDIYAPEKSVLKDSAFNLEPNSSVIGNTSKTSSTFSPPSDSRRVSANTNSVAEYNLKNISSCDNSSELKNSEVDNKSLNYNLETYNSFDLIF